MKGRCKSKANFVWLVNVTKCVGMEPTIVKAAPKGVLVVFGGEVGLDYKTVMNDSGEDMSDGRDLEVLIFWQALLKGGFGEVFEQVMGANFFQKNVPCVQLARGALEFTVRLKHKVKSSVLPSRGETHLMRHNCRHETQDRSYMSSCKTKYRVEKR
jgi:hypothetical protein